MKKSSNTVRGIKVLFVLALAITILLGSCAKRVKFRPSPLVPAAAGYVKIKKDENKNYSIEIKISNLADPERLYPAKQAYVVWIETDNNGIKNLGQLRSSKSLFSGALEGSLNTVTAFEPVKVFITAEDTTTPQHPGAQTVIQTRNFD